MPEAERDRLLETVELLMEQDAWGEAIQTLQQHPDLVQRDWKLSWDLGWAFFKLEDFDNAAVALQHAVALHPRHYGTHWALAAVLAEKQAYAAAEAAYKASLALRESYSSRIGLAFLYHCQGLLGQAEQAHLEGLRLKPQSRERVEAYADFLSDIGREEEAQMHYARAASLPWERPQKEAS